MNYNIMFVNIWNRLKNTASCGEITTLGNTAENAETAEKIEKSESTGTVEDDGTFLNDEISVVKFINAYRSNQQFLTGTISAPIVGRWKRVRSFVCHCDEQPFQWKEQPRDEASESGLSWKFGSDGRIDYFADNTILETDSYRYDCCSGRLVVDCVCTMVVRLTQENMICISWGCSESKCIYQDCYVRI